MKARAASAAALVAILAGGGVAQAPTSSAATTGSTTNEQVVLAPSTLRAMAVKPPNRYSASFPTIAPGSPRQDVRALQLLLLDTGRKTDGSTSYTASTSNAVKSFQSANKLPVTGSADDATLTRLVANATSGQTRNSTMAVQTLLLKHGYAWQAAAGSSGAPVFNTHYGPTTDRDVRAFQIGHGIISTSYVGTYTWRTLFSAKTSGPLYGIDQHATGAASKANCGPASAIALLLTMGRNPHGWTGSVASRGAAVEYFRTTTAKVSYSAAYGTESTQLVPAFSRLGISTSAGGFAQELAAAKAGRPSLSAGDTEFLPWWGKTPYSHYLAVLGWDGAQVIVMDPWSGTLHRLTPAQLQKFTSKQVGPKETGNMLPPSRAGVIVN